MIIIPEPMRAPTEPIDLDRELTPALKYYVQPKYDGIRIKFYKRVPYTRTGKLIPNRQIADSLTEIVFNSPLRELNIDGELLLWNSATDWYYPFNVVQSVVMSKEQVTLTALQDWIYIVFDYDDGAKFQSFEDRWLELVQLFYDKDTIRNRIMLADCAECINIETIKQVVLSNDNSGYEGSMIRKAHARYKNGRVTVSEGYIRKYVEWVRDEATVVDMIQLYRNLDTSCTMKDNMVPEEQIGALVVEHPKFGRFNIGSGFNTQQRKNMWLGQASLIGRTVTFKYKPTHLKDAPCPAIFVGFRAKEDYDKEGS